MKTILYVISLFLLFVFLTCCQKSRRDDPTILGEENTLKGLKDVELSEVERKNKAKENYRTDSLRIEQALSDALKIGMKNKQVPYYFEEYQIETIDSLFKILVNITSGQILSKSQRHILIRIFAYGDTYLNLYQIVKDKPKSVILRKQNSLTYINDTIRDVNGDGDNDYLVHWYPLSGCCRRNVYNVYLNQVDKESFTSDYQFINPTFLPRKKTILGVGYGRPGEVGLYKYKWNRYNIDTIEFIYPDINHPEQFVKTKKGTFSPTEKDGKILKKVPKEYLSIDSYEWFSNYKQYKE